jgi:membrane protein implicated in regulation of membrane protease activity
MLVNTAHLEHDGPRGFLARLMQTLRGSALWIGTFAFAAIAAMAAFFFALAAIAGTFIIIGTLALVWLIFRIAGSRSARNGAKADSNVLNARRGPHGWTVDGIGPFGSR